MNKVESIVNKSVNLTNDSTLFIAKITENTLKISKDRKDKVIGSFTFDKKSFLKIKKDR